MKNDKAILIERLSSYARKDIIFTDHVLIRMVQRQISTDEIIDNIINPRRLEYAIRELGRDPDEEKYDCYFGYSRTQCQRYVLILQEHVIVVTAIKINRRWQKTVESRLRKR